MPLKNIVWILKPKSDNINYIDLIESLSNNQPVDLSNYEVLQATSVFSFREEIMEYVLERGFSSLLTSELLLEHIVAKGTGVPQIILVLQRYLDNLSIDNELIIVDPYFFARPRSVGYEAMFCNIIEKYLPAIDDLIFITNNQIDNNVKTNIENGLLSLKPGLNLQYNTSGDYHDRYWISSNREKGLVMGTSLNGLGNKLALVDRINTSDVRLIIGELINDGLI